MNTEAIINEEIDPQEAIDVLKVEVQELRKQLVMYTGMNVNY